MHGQLSNAQSSQTPAGSVKPIDRAIVGPSEVVMPNGVFLLIRKGRGIGAIRFTSIEPGKTVSTGKATYESYFQGDGSGSLQTSNVVKRTGKIDVKPLKGIGRASFQLGHTTLHIGKWSFGCDDPGVVNMWPAGKTDKDYGFEFAPTSAREIKEVDASDKRLQWFRFDSNRQSVSLFLSDLPK